VASQPPGQQYFRLAQPDEVEGVADGIGSRGAGAVDGGVGPANPQRVAYAHAGHVGADPRDKEWVDAAWPALLQDALLGPEAREAAAAGHDDADVVAGGLVQGQSRRLQGLTGGHYPQLGKAPATTGSPAVHVAGRIEALYLGGDARGEAGGIEESDRANAGAARQEPLPERPGVQP
jgi:hypothetical protein